MEICNVLILALTHVSFYISYHVFSLFIFLILMFDHDRVKYDFRPDEVEKLWGSEGGRRGYRFYRCLMLDS